MQKELIISSKNKTTLLIPAKNEAANLSFVLSKIPKEIDEVILIDGKSTDDTINTAKSIYPDIKILKQQGPKGKGVALQEGFNMASGEIIVMIDADGSMNPLEIPEFLNKINSGYDLVKGSRFLENGYSEDMTSFRKFGNAFFVKLINLFFNRKYTDLCYGYMAMRKHLVESLELKSEGFSIETEIVVKASKSGFNIAEIPSIESNRIHGYSNLHSLKDGFRILWTIIKERFS